MSKKSPTPREDFDGQRHEVPALVRICKIDTCPDWPKYNSGDSTSAKSSGRANTLHPARVVVIPKSDAHWSDKKPSKKNPDAKEGPIT